MPQRIICYNCKQVLYEGTEKLCLADEIRKQLGGKCPKCRRDLFSTPSDAEVRPANKSNVFIVHGKDHYSLKELRDLVHNVGLNPIILHDQPSKGMTLIEKLEKYSDVVFAFVILTPDDLGTGLLDVTKMVFNAIGKENATKEDVAEFFKTHPVLTFMNFESDLIAMFKARARQNVILEFGYFIGKLGRGNVCCLYKGNIELPSDMQGICYIHFENSIMEVRELILQELTEEILTEEVMIQFYI
jgi:predicted nucleotide-binding protein